MKLVYLDLKSETRLEAYADTVVLEKEGKTNYIAAIRFGGYPESVKGLSEAIYGGGTVTIEINGGLLTAYSRIEQYRKELSHDGIYAEATLLIRDEEEITDSEEKADKNGKPRKCYLFCEHDNHDRLFEELDKKTGVPLIPEFNEYVLSELQKRDILKPLQVISNRENFDVWLLTLTENEKNVIGTQESRRKSYGENSDEFGDIIGHSEQSSETRTPVFYPHELATLNDVLLLSPYGFNRADKITFTSDFFKELSKSTPSVIAAQLSDEPNKEKIIYAKAYVVSSSDRN